MHPHLLEGIFQLVNQVVLVFPVEPQVRCGMVGEVIIIVSVPPQQRCFFVQRRNYLTRLYDVVTVCFILSLLWSNSSNKVFTNI